MCIPCRPGKEGKVGSLGKQYVYYALAQAIISPLVGKLMDVASQATGRPNYLVPFLANAFFLILTLITVSLFAKKQRATSYLLLNNLITIIA